MASSSAYAQTYTYNSLGNITYRSDTGDYFYSETGYTNPHAATTINGTNLTYDTNGNLLAYGSKTYAWDYRNRLAESNVGSGTTTYGYDHQQQRVLKTTGGVSTVYPNKLYNVSTSTVIKHVFAGDELIASVSGSGAATTTQYIHADHLGGANVETNTSGSIVEVTDYYPYGTERIATGSFNEQRKFAGTERDTESDLDYMQARYYRASTGGFISQDPVFWEIGQTRDGVKALFDPQSQNSYSYARSNPIVNKDAQGRYWESVLDAISFGLSVRDYQQDPSFINGVLVATDGASLAFPIPALFGYLKHGNEARRIAAYANSSGMTGSQIIQFAVEFARNSNFKFTSRAWSPGKFGDSAGNLVDHYVRHGDQVGASSVGDYYQRANGFIDNKTYTNSWKEGSDTVYYNKNTNYAAYTDKSGQLKSYYKVTDPKKLKSYGSRVEAN